jgi:2-keto-myo-inositol isomerase
MEILGSHVSVAVGRGTRTPPRRLVQPERLRFHMSEHMPDAAHAPADRVFLNGATIMTTSTTDHLDVARRTGFTGVEVRAERLLADADEVQATAGMVRPGEAWSLNGVQIQVTADGALDRPRLEDDLEPRLEVCRLIGAAYLLVVPPRAPAAPRDRALHAVREGLAIARDRAAQDGVRVAFEFLGFSDCPIDTPALAGEVVGAVPGVEVVLDSCHWHASGGGSLTSFPIERLAMVHLNDAPAKPPRAIEDADRVLPGLGVIALPTLIAELRAGGYRGPYSLETFNPAYWQEDPEGVARRGRAAVDRLLAPAPQS